MVDACLLRSASWETLPSMINFWAMCHTACVPTLLRTARMVRSGCLDASFLCCIVTHIHCTLDRMLHSTIWQALLSVHTSNLWLQVISSWEYQAMAAVCTKCCRCCSFIACFTESEGSSTCKHLFQILSCESQGYTCVHMTARIIILDELCECCTVFYLCSLQINLMALRYNVFLLVGCRYERVWDPWVFSLPSRQ